MIEIRQLKHFIAVVEAGGIRQAARRVSLTPSSILRSVQLMESHYGIKLFEKSGKSRTLTLAGEQLLADAKSLVHSFDSIAPKLEQMSDKGSGHLRVGLAPVVSDLLMAATTSRLINDYPTVQISTTIDTAEKLLGLLHDHRLDVIIALENVVAGSGKLQRTRVHQDAGVWLVRRNHPLLSIRNPSIEVLGQYPLLTQHFEPFYDSRLKETLLMAGLSENRRISLSQCNDYRILCDITMNTDAILLGPRMNFRELKYARNLHRLKIPLELAPIWFTAAWPVMPSPSPLTLRYIEIMTEEAASRARCGIAE